MHIILFRPKNRQQWIDWLREKGWTIKVTYELRKVIGHAVVLDAASGSWEKFAKLFAERGMQVYLLLDDDSHLESVELASLGITKVITTMDEPAWATEEKMSSNIREPPVDWKDENNFSESVPLSQRIKRKETDAVLHVDCDIDGAVVGSIPTPLYEEAETVSSAVQTEQRGMSSITPAFTASIPSVLAVYAAKGGIGATVFLLHLAALLSQHGCRVCILDLDTMHGTVAATLQLQPTKTIVDLARRIEDPKASKACLYPTEMGFSIVAAPLTVGQFTLRQEQVRSILRFLKSEFDVVLIDTAACFDAVTKMALQEAEQLYVMTTTEAASLHNLMRMQPLLASLRPAPEIFTVLNRLSGSMDKVRLRSEISWPIVVELPEDQKVAQAIRQGECVSSKDLRNPYVAQMNRLVDHWLGLKPLQSKKSQSMLRRFFPKKKTTYSPKG